jgi:hypothetical protein
MVLLWDLAELRSRNVSPIAGAREPGARVGNRTCSIRLFGDVNLKEESAIQGREAVD